MDIRVPQPSLLEGLLAVQRAVDHSGNVPQLGGVLIKTLENGLYLEGSDSHLFIRRHIDAEIDSPGAIVLPARYFVELVKRIPPENLRLSDSDNLICTLKWNSGQCEIHGYSAEGFLSIDECPSEGISIPAKALRKLIRETTFSAAKEESRPIFGGMLLLVEEGRMRAVCTDGVRLTVSEARSKPASSDADMASTQRSAAPARTEFNAIIPVRTLLELLRLTGDADQVNVALDEKGVYFTWNRTWVFSRLLSGRFPEYERVIPKQFKTSFRVDRNAFRSACDKASLMTKGVTNPILLEISEDSVTVRSNTPGVGEVVEVLEAIVEGEPLNVAFNARFLIEGLDVIEESTVFFGISGIEAPSVLKPAHSDDFLYVVLPLKIG
ncbi:MAG TPA: DNA polymerase III subunit beta [Clostridia bacterium]|nr:DNA polymerase III subunit beta [Clostridia bacterium]